MARRRNFGNTLEELIYDPIGYHFRGGSFTRRPYGGHQHIHAASSNPYVMLALIRKALRLNLSVRENPYTDPVDPVHTEGSHHYQTFPGVYGPRKKKLGEAIDVSGADAAERAFFRYARRVLTGRKPIGGGGGGGGGRPAQPTVAMPQQNIAALLASLGTGPQATVPNVRVPRPHEVLAGLSAAAIEQNAGAALPLLESSPLTGRASSLTSDLTALRRRLLAL